MTTITITGKQPGKTDVTISSTVNPAVKTVVPVTVLSRNLLSYRLTSLALCTIHSNHHERSHSLDGLEKIRSVGA